jgi:5-methylcytosine-specific restriction endonuclease McrA
VRERIYERDRFTCQYCGANRKSTPGLMLEIDHVRPLSKGGNHEDTNLVTACFDCIRGKRAQEVEPPRVVSGLLASTLEREWHDLDALLDEAASCERLQERAY